jgi:putative nucleotidyltransferase with HDIG domain
MVVSDTYKKFIERQMQYLAEYDSRRPVGHTYEFHLHSYRVAELIKNLARLNGRSDDYCEALYWATLPHDIGKTALPIDIWDMDDKPSDEIKDERRTHTSKGVEIIRAEYADKCESDPFLKLLLDIMENHHEHLDGSGYLGKTANDLSIEVQMVCICDAFDGYSISRPHFKARDLSPQAVIDRMNIEKNGQYNPDLLKLFSKIN